MTRLESFAASLTLEMLEMDNAGKAIGLYPDSRMARAAAIAERRIREFVLATFECCAQPEETEEASRCLDEPPP